MDKPVIILGAQRLSKMALEILLKNGIIVYGFLDDDQATWKQTIHHVPVLGSTSEKRYWDLIGEKCEVFIAIENQGHRQRLATMLYEQNKVIPINAKQPTKNTTTTATQNQEKKQKTGVTLG